MVYCLLLLSCFIGVIYCGVWFVFISGLCWGLYDVCCWLCVTFGLFGWWLFGCSCSLGLLFCCGLIVVLTVFDVCCFDLFGIRLRVCVCGCALLWLFRIGWLLLWIMLVSEMLVCWVVGYVFCICVIVFAVWFASLFVAFVFVGVDTGIAAGLCWLCGVVVIDGFKTCWVCECFCWFLIVIVLLISFILYLFGGFVSFFCVGFVWLVVYNLCLFGLLSCLMILLYICCDRLFLVV